MKKNTYHIVIEDFKGFDATLHNKCTYKYLKAGDNTFVCGYKMIIPLKEIDLDETNGIYIDPNHNRIVRVKSYNRTFPFLVEQAFRLRRSCDYYEEYSSSTPNYDSGAKRWYESLSQAYTKNITDKRLGCVYWNNTNYNGLWIQFKDAETAQRVARALYHAAKLAGAKNDDGADPFAN